MPNNTRQPKKVFGKDNPNYSGGSFVPNSTRAVADKHGYIDNNNIQALKESFNSYVENEGNGYDDPYSPEEAISAMRDHPAEECPSFEDVKEYAEDNKVLKAYANDAIFSAYRKHTGDMEFPEKLIKHGDNVQGSDGGSVVFDDDNKSTKYGEPVPLGYQFADDQSGHPSYVSVDGEAEYNE